MHDICPNDRKDWANSGLTSALVWGIPIAVIITTAFLDDPMIRTIVWTVCWAEMGVACLANAFRCGRVHCHLTGPFFLLGSAASLLHGFDTLPFGPHGWRWIGMTMLFGGIVLNYLPERIWGKYTKRSQE